MHSIKDIILKSLITEEMDKYKHPKAPTVNGKDKKEVLVEVEKRDELSCLPTSKHIKVIQDFTTYVESCR